MQRAVSVTVRPANIVPNFWREVFDQYIQRVCRSSLELCSKQAFLEKTLAKTTVHPSGLRLRGCLLRSRDR